MCVRLKRTTVFICDHTMLNLNTKREGDRLPDMLNALRIAKLRITHITLRMAERKITVAYLKLKRVDSGQRTVDSIVCVCYVVVVVVCLSQRNTIIKTILTKSLIINSSKRSAFQCKCGHTEQNIHTAHFTLRTYTFAREYNYMYMCVLNESHSLL